jgi:flagellar protein FlaG
MNIPAIGRVASALPVTPALPTPAAAAPRVPDTILKGAALQGAGDAQASQAAALEKAARRMEDYVRSVGRSLQFRIDENSGRVVVSVRDPSTGELIRQIPSESALRIAESLDSVDSTPPGVIIDGRA